MAEIKRNYQPGKKATTTPRTVTPRQPRQPLTSLFTPDNYKWMAIGAAVIALGMFLMSGGKNVDPNEFDPSVVYSTRRITIAPIVILLGLMIEVYAIFRKPNKATTDTTIETI